MNEDLVKGKKIRCVGRRISKPCLIQYIGAHKAMQIFVGGRSTIAEVVKTWRVLRR